jgi:transcription-repair coupling factor (superfamily II helicase)
VAILCPTTILAAQHEKTFAERLAQTPLACAMLSRLTGRSEEKEILRSLEGGSIDCVIGTHRLLSRDIKFKNLGLVIIDEEQRFGVKQKEKFKDLRAYVDLLSLSATPIPRTLSLALAKLRDLSILSTPPPERLPIHTLVYPYAPKLIREAISFELERGGQIYFLHNRIETIGRIKEKLQKMKLELPLKIQIIHGRMSESEILRAMNSFREKRCNLLLATTIIENGLDIASANTLIVDDATRLGLAQAHQLRGRIGRSPERGFSYFLYRPDRLTEKAAERLEALKDYAELGAGYQIALRDLEIRGAGNILGKEQSGAINKVGLNLYCQMLADVVENERQTKNIPT